MHPAFDLKRLENLPLHLGKRAKLLAQVDFGKPKPGLRFSEFAILAEVASGYQSSMLPLYWIILYPSRIPSAAELDDPSPFSGHTILLQAVIFALLGVHQGSLGNPDREQYRDIWSRLYPWIQFLQAHYDLLPR
ncbi:hypothetical protein C8F01DRAFT_1258408 [Mycena amicta]|nr:hypothetical protein C8F01DRAFT_1258408 [Mycena amicta]